MLAASILALGAVAVHGCGRDQVETVSFVDDRVIWGREASSVRRAAEQSDSVDEAFQLVCDALKCLLPSRSPVVFWLRL